MTFKPQLFVLFLLVSLTSANVQGATVTFDFNGLAGADLDDGTSMGTTSVTVDGITLNLTAISQVDGVTAGTFNQNASPAPGNFGINAPGSTDSTDAVDGDEGIESILFSVTSSVPLSSLTLDTFDFDRITNAGMDEGQLSFAGGSTINFTNNEVPDADLLAVNESITTGQTFTLSFVAGNGFGLESLTFTATAVAVPEPSSLGFLLLAATGLFVRRR